MILHPGIMALLGGSFVVTVMTLFAVTTGFGVLLKWDIRSSSAYQLSLERRTYLVSTIMNYVLGFQVISAFLFVYTVDDLHGLFVGAMCATGSLNANPVGWYALVLKIAGFFLAGLWIALNRLDQSAEDYPMVRLKYLLLLLLVPVFGGDFFLQIRYFSGLDADIITSCCGSLFSDSDNVVASGMASVPIRPAMAAFYGGGVVLLLLSFFCLLWKAAFLRYLLALWAPLFFAISLVAVVSFISVYFYELPTHHCPFDIFQKEYGYAGYPLYASLFGGVFFAVLPGLFRPCASIGSLGGSLERSERRWLCWSMGGTAAFLMISSYPLVFGSFTAFS